MQPLEGIVILDLTRLLPGPAATMHLADYGATIIKVEDTAEGDYLRAIPPHTTDASGARVNPAYAALNRGKRSIRINLKQAEGRDILLRLVERADALLEGFRPGVLDKLGLDWSTLRARNPRLVLCSLTGYGQDGPLRDVAGHDINYCALAGVLEQTRAHGQPAVPSLQIGDTLGGTLSAVTGLLVALLGALRTGIGTRVDVAMADGVLAHHFFAHAAVDAGLPLRGGQELLTGGAACYQIYRCSDGQYIAVGALELKFWQKFCDLADLADLRDQHWARGEIPGSANATATIDTVKRRMAERTRAEWLATFADTDACVTPLLSPAEALAHPQFTERQRVQRVGKVTAIGPLARLDGHAYAPAGAPAPGEHTRAILEELGLTPDAVAALYANGAVA